MNPVAVPNTGTIIQGAILLCLLLNKPHLFNITQCRYILMLLITFTHMLNVSACTLAISQQVNTKTLKGKIQ